MQQRSHEGQMSMAHMARFLGRMGPTHSPLVAPMSSIFVLLDASWPKTIYKKDPSVGRKRERRQNIETRNRSLGDQRLEGETPTGHCRCDLHPLQRLHLSPWWRGSSPPLDYGFVAVAICISLLFFIVLAPYELYNMIMAIFVSLLWWIFLWVIYEIAIVL
jgi:hypothetical protein